ncbi:MAG: amino acid permease [Thermoproteota archaeon]|nr:amino acid permease [Candidatus Brockarchaeota archaeon]
MGNEHVKPVLRRKLGLWDAVSIGLGAIIGAGIFVLIGIASGMAGPAVIFSIMVSGMSAIFTALSFAMLGAAFPKAGGVYEYGHELLSHSLGFVLGWTWIFGNIVMGATASLGFGYYLSSIFSIIPFKIGALMLVLIVALLNIIGVKQAAVVNNLIVVMKIGVLLLFILIGLPRVRLSNFENLFPHGIIPVFQAAGLFYFAYIGFPRISTVAEEVKEPEKNIPLAIMLSLSISTIIYLLTSITALGLMGYEALGDSPTPIGDAAKLLGLSGIVEAGALLATFSVVLTSIMGQSRVFFAMARNEEIPQFLSKIHEKLETPVYSILLSGTIMTTLVLTVDISSLALLGSFCILFTHIFTNCSALRLYNLKGKKIKAYLQPFSGILGLVMSIILTFSLGISIIWGVVACGAGFLWYFTYKTLHKRKSKPREL